MKRIEPVPLLLAILAIAAVMAIGVFIARQSATDLQNALQQAHRESQSHLLAPVGKMAPVNSSPSRLVTRTSLPPSLQNGASCWGPRIGIIHLSERRCRAGMSGSVNQSEAGTLVPHFG